ncbi:MAG: tetratricopeptide repeat protein [Pyrinomonadaceae bacterium]|nr:tetratricopeptide repeat protein [Pyrinomonadaceae bacterium]
MKKINLILFVIFLCAFSVFSQDDLNKQINQGIFLLKAKEFKKANEHFKDLAKPNYPEALLFLGFSLENSERFSEAIKTFDKVIQALPENFDAWLEKGVCQFALKDSTSAIASIKKAIQIEPTAAYGHRKLADVYFQMSLFPEAAVSYKTADKLEPNVYYVNYRIGLAYYNLKRFTEAVPYFKKASEIELRNQNAHLMLANSYFSANSFALAVNSYNKVIEINPENADAVFGLGSAYLKLNDKDSALKQLELLRGVNYVLYNRLDTMIKTPPTKAKTISKLKK